MKDTNREFRVRTYGRTELAQEYCPLLQPQSAYRRLTAWIKLNPQLSQKLLDGGRPRRGRTFTPNEVKMIVEYLGEP